MGKTRSGWRYTNPTDGAGIALHPFDGMPNYIADQLLSDGAEAQGNSGLVHYFDHFMNWRGPLTEGAAGGWVLSGVTGAATVVFTNVASGEIVLTADATGNCDPTLQLGSASLGANFIYTVGKRMWCFARLKFLTVASTEFLFGLATPDTEPTVTNTFPSDGIFFDKAASDTKMSFDVRKDGTSTQKASISGTLVDATYTTLGFQVTKEGNIIPYQDGSAIAAGVVAAGASNIPGAADVMQPMIGFRGASMSVTLDWVYFAQEL